MGLRARSLDGARPSETEAGAVMGQGTTWANPYQVPIHAEVDGEPVRMIQIGDKPGFSPVALCVGRERIPTEVRLRDVRISDGAYLPLQTSGFEPTTNR
jgi:hypothetical protein